MAIHNVSSIKQYTVALYREKFGNPAPVGSGILVKYQNQCYLISAYHVFDMEEERLQIENDPEEQDIPHDDMESIKAKGVNSFFCINDDTHGLVFTWKYTEPNVFNDDTEWCVCKLSDKVVQYFIEAGKAFYIINKITCPKIKSDSTIIISGYPEYAQKENQEVYRSFSSKMLERDKLFNNALFRVHFDNKAANNYEMGRRVELPNVGIAGMSGGGLWYKLCDNYIPIGIIIMQNPNDNYIEGFRIDEILNSYLK